MSGPQRIAAVIALFAAATAGCASKATLPAIARETGERHVGKFVWVDLVTRDPARARQFYGELFGWTFDGDDDYAGIRDEGRPVGGIVRLRREEPANRPSAWIESLSVEDVDASAELVKRRGGTVEVGPLDAGPRGRLAVVTDPGGAVVALLRSRDGDPPDQEPATGQFLWRELWTQDPDAAVGFYAELVGYEPELVEFEGHAYHVLKRDGRPRAGVIEAPSTVDALWLPYVRVEDPERAAARAKELGARIVLSDADAAILVDPLGAAFGVQRWPEEPSQP